LIIIGEATVRRTDAGSGPVTAILVVAILALLVGAGFAASGAAAGDEAASANHAADAAALGGAQGVLDNLPASLSPGFEDVDDIADLLGGGTCVQAGRAKAAQMAAANGATLTSYCWNVFADRVAASVRMNRTNVAGPPTSADAEASSTFEASACTLDPSFVRPTPSPSPTGTSSPSPTTSPTSTPAPIKTWVDCGFGPLDVHFSGGRFHFERLGHIADDLEPRLTG
jgi:hypothetical protein